MHGRSLFCPALASVLAVIAATAGTGCTPKGGTSGPTMGHGPNHGAAPTNTSIASAGVLTKGAALTVALPCSGRLYFGPFAFTQDPETVKIVFANKSNSGAQVCTGGQWVDKNDVAIGGNAGMGCAEGANPVKGYIEHTHSPGNGGDSATPAYFFVQVGDGAAAAGCESTTATLTLE